MRKLSGALFRMINNTDICLKPHKNDCCQQPKDYLELKTNQEIVWAMMHLQC